MKYTATQIKKAEKNYTEMMRVRTLSDYDVDTIGVNTAEQRMQFHNDIITKINSGDKALERQWKLFFLNEEVKADRKKSEKAAKLAANKEASSDVLAPIKAAKKMGEFGKWLNTPGNQYRSQHFNKKYTEEAVVAFLNK